MYGFHVWKAFYWVFFVISYMSLYPSHILKGSASDHHVRSLFELLQGLHELIEKEKFTLGDFRSVQKKKFLLADNWSLLKGRGIKPGEKGSLESLSSCLKKQKKFLEKDISLAKDSSYKLHKFARLNLRFGKRMGLKRSLVGKFFKKYFSHSKTIALAKGKDLTKALEGYDDEFRVIMGQLSDNIETQRDFLDKYLGVESSDLIVDDWHELSDLIGLEEKITDKLMHNLIDFLDALNSLLDIKKYDAIRSAYASVESLLVLDNFDIFKERSRRLVLKEVVQRVDRGKSVFILGLTRMGKTSILQGLSQIYNSYRFACGPGTTLESLNKVSERRTGELFTAQLSDSSKVVIMDEIFGLSNDLLDMLDKSVEKGSRLICSDVFSKFSSKKLKRLNHLSGDPLFKLNIFSDKEMSYVILDALKKYDLSMESSALKKISEVTCNLPYLVFVFTYGLIKYCAAFATGLRVKSEWVKGYLKSEDLKKLISEGLESGPFIVRTNSLKEGLKHSYGYLFENFPVILTLTDYKNQSGPEIDFLLEVGLLEKEHNKVRLKGELLRRIVKEM